MNPDTDRRLVNYTGLLNRYGPDSAAAKAYLHVHAHDSEFLDLAETAAWLKRAFMSEGTMIATDKAHWLKVGADGMPVVPAPAPRRIENERPLSVVGTLALAVGAAVSVWLLIWLACR